MLHKKNHKNSIILIEQGIKAGNEVKEPSEQIDNAVDMFNKINDFILDGMPCDKVNEFIISEENIVKILEKLEKRYN